MLHGIFIKFCWKTIVKKSKNFMTKKNYIYIFNKSKLNPTEFSMLYFKSPYFHFHDHFLIYLLKNFIIKKIETV